MKEYDMNDFTLDNYRNLFAEARKKYKFIGFSEALQTEENSIILRHDVDWALGRAEELAAIEKELEIKSTYFIYAHSIGYNIYEKKEIERIKKIISLGHDIGLHVDFEFYHLYGTGVGSAEDYFEMEMKQIEAMFDTKVVACSFHNPEQNEVINLNEDLFCGRINAYAMSIQNKFKYCSDSNGYWRYECLEDVLNDGYNHLQILLHPMWWTKEAIMPAEKVYKYFIDEANAKYNEYDTVLVNARRENIGKEKIEGL